MANPTQSLIAEVREESHFEGNPASPSIMTPDLSMAILTWITFFLLLGILYKFAWKPILAALDEREAKIRRSLDDAQKAKAELEQIEQARAQRIAQADEQAKAILDRARRAAVEAASIIEYKAKEEAQITLNNATHEINALAQKTKTILKKESVDLAVVLAEKIIQENLDVNKQQKLIDQFLKDFDPGSHEKL